MATNDFSALIPPLVGDLLSFITAAFVLTTFSLIPTKPGHIRQKLICNLIVAELVLEGNNSVSGIMILARGRDLDNGPWCEANGFITQLAVQAVDCCIFSISFILLYMITHPSALLDPTIPITVLLIIAPWILPIITSSIALAKHYIHPIHGNYCWIQANPTYLRYILTHGWRFVIIVAVVAMGVFTRFYLKRHPIEPQGSFECVEGPSKDEGVRDDPDQIAQLPKLQNQQETHYIVVVVSEREKGSQIE
ncbi:hypothetical protein N431DRAFT_469765 [Stipitochalara longipes BDJ]|nr:hypothetical protein N431DRAFT_469765 [Stipitochalara longipes BDJ]